MVPLRLRLVALVAAYAVALQGLLTAFAPIAAAGPQATLQAGLLCSLQIAGEPAQSGGHDERLCAAACVMHGAAAAPSPPDVGAPGFAVQPVSNTPTVAALKPLWRSAPSARAPPFI